MRKKDVLTYGAFAALFGQLTDESRERIMSTLNRAPKPTMLCGRSVPESLNTITFGQLDDLHDLASMKEGDIASEAVRIVLGTNNGVLDEDVNDVFGFINWVTAEVVRINKVFDSIKPSPTSEEIQAGVDQLNFGSFGVLDWYARRMGIGDHEVVRDVAWVRIFNCMRIDYQRAEYEKRLSQVHQKKYASAKS